MLSPPWVVVVVVVLPWFQGTHITHTHTHTKTHVVRNKITARFFHPRRSSSTMYIWSQAPVLVCLYVCVCLWTVATNTRRVVKVGACAHHISRGKQCHAVQCGNELRLRECVLHRGAPHERGSHGFCGESIFFFPLLLRFPAAGLVLIMG